MASSVSSESRASDEAVRLHSNSVYSLILPSHEDSSPETVRLANSPEAVRQPNGNVLTCACDDLEVPPESMKILVDIFFRTYTSFSLFRQPTFYDKLNQISSGPQLKALLAAIFAFACKGASKGQLQVLPNFDRLSAVHFSRLASENVDRAMVECGDEQPPLCLLQALILSTHWMIIKGVRGRAWRSLGRCIRLVFELGLDSLDIDKDIDSDHVDVNGWCEDEERRRAYWAINDLDIFATIIKQGPMSTNWAANKVLLPATDDHWFRGQVQKSCFLEVDSIDRVNALQHTGSESARAWHVVINSFVEEAYVLVRRANQKARQASKRRRTTSKAEFGTCPSSRSDCMTLINALHLYHLALPQSLKFQGQILDFGAREPDSNMASSQIQRQSAIYHIAILIEVTKLLALRPYVFESYVKRLAKTTQRDKDMPLERSGDNSSRPSLGSAVRELQQCVNASDTMVDVVLNCSEFHCQYVNPCIAHASWLAATVQLLKQELAEDESEKRMARSQFEVLKATNSQFIHHWEMSTVPKQNLDELATRLKQFTAISKGQAQEENAAAGQHPTRSYSSQAADGGAAGRHLETELGRAWHSNGTTAAEPNSLARLSGPSLVFSMADNAIQQTNFPDLLSNQNSGTTDPAPWLDPRPTVWSGIAQEDNHGPAAMGVDMPSDVPAWFAFAHDDPTGELSNYLDEMFSGSFIG